jgi:hypothetical protein
MQGLQVTFLTVENVRHGRRPTGHRPIEAANSLGIQGATMTAGVAGLRRDGRLPAELGVVGAPKG